MHFSHRAKLPDDSAIDAGFTSGPIEFEKPKGRDAFTAQLVIWAIGKVTPNNVFIPQALLNEQGYVLTDPYLRAKGHTNVFAVGDIAQTDALRSSARNDGWMLVAKNISACLNGEEDTAMGKYQPQDTNGVPSWACGKEKAWNCF